MNDLKLIFLSGVAVGLLGAASIYILAKIIGALIS